MPQVRSGSGATATARGRPAKQVVEGELDAELAERREDAGGGVGPGDPTAGAIGVDVGPQQPTTRGEVRVGQTQLRAENVVQSHATLVAYTRHRAQPDCRQDAISLVNQGCYRSRMSKPESPGEWVRRVRRAAKLTQQEFADRIGIGRPQVGNWERGAGAPEWASVEKIMRAFPDAPPPPFVAESSLAGRYEDLRAALRKVLERRASTMTGSQVLAAQRVIEDLPARNPAGRVDDAAAEYLFDLIIGGNR